MENRQDVLNEFIKDNPEFANPSGHLRRLADWQYDTKYRGKVSSGDISFSEALSASVAAATKMLPKQSSEADLHKLNRNVLADISEQYSGINTKGANDAA